MTRPSLSNLSLAVVLALGLSVHQPGHADTADNPTSANALEGGRTGHFLDVPSLLGGTATLQNSPLLAGVKLPKLEPHTDYEDYHTSSATLSRDDDGPGGTLVVVNRDDGSFVSLIDTPGNSGLVVGRPDGSQTFYPAPAVDWLKEDSVADAVEAARMEPAGVTPKLNDSYTIITLLAGFSRSAADKAYDPTAYGFAQVESVNQALRNSGVTEVRLALGGVEIVEQNYPTTPQTLGNLPSIFKNSVKADVIGGFFTPHPDDTAGGWAHAPGRLTVQHVTGPSAFRHELGHNVGGGHCNETGSDNYKHGHSTGTGYKTILCGNNIAYYSSPALTAPDGKPLGNARTADMARLWREQAQRMASYDSGQPLYNSFLLKAVSLNECARITGVAYGVGTLVSMAPCDALDSRQQWIEWVTDNDEILFRSRVRPDLCLAGETSTYVTLQSCDLGNKRIRWIQKGSGYISVQPGNYPHSPIRLVGRAAYDTTTKLWATTQLFEENPETRWVKDKDSTSASPRVRLHTKYGNLCMEVSRDHSGLVGDPVNLGKCHTGTRVRWTLEVSGQIRSEMNTGLCLGSSDGTTLSLQDCTRDDMRVQWNESKTNESIENRILSLCITSAAQPVEGQRVSLSTCRQADNQRWTLIAAPKP